MSPGACRNGKVWENKSRPFLGISRERPLSDDRPLVSVIIPTYRRPNLLLRAVRCALSQTLRNIEVMVVIDGPDEETATALQGIEDSRLQVLTLMTNCGPSAARNSALEAAGAQWVAFLDDDDEWMPEKLELQHKAATQSSHRYLILSCRFIARTQRGDLVWPGRLPHRDERLDEYLFCQHNLFGGEGMVLPTTILTQTELARRVPFDPGLRRHGDIDWLIRAVQMEGCRVEFIPDSRPLAIWNLEPGSTRISATASWQQSLNWALTHRARLSPRAVAGFLLTWTSLGARTQGQWTAFFRLPVFAFRLGTPRFVDLLAHLIIWLIPSGLRNRISIFLQKVRRK